MIYLATPYSDPDPDKREWRYEQAVALWQHFLKACHGTCAVFSPIVHAHPAAVKYDMPADYAFWKSFNGRMLSSSSDLWVANLDGWENSAGIKGEIELAGLIGVPVTHVFNAQDIVSWYGLGAFGG